MVKVLRGVDLSLQNLISQISIGDDIDNKLIVEIASPDRATEGKDRGVSIFCYNIKEHETSRNQKSIIRNGSVYFPPMVLDLYYMITINTIKEEEIPEIRQKIMKFFYDTPILAGKMLVNELRINEYDNAFLDFNYNTEIKIRLNPLSIEETNQLWTLFPGTKYRPSFSYVVSPVVIPSTQRMSTALVKSKTIHLSDGV